MPSVSETDAQRVEAVMQMAARLGARLSVVICGDVRLHLSEPWPAKSELPADAQAVVVDRAADPKLEALRAKGRREFGRRVPDDLLRSLDPLI